MAEKRILGYLKHTLGTGLNTGMSSLTLMSAYIDADWAVVLTIEGQQEDLLYSLGQI
jgi:hypothetical protein